MITQQQPGGEYQPVIYISRALSLTEQWYAQIEKEALALTWGCERLSDYLIGLHFHVVTDHKPLILILSTKSLESLPLWVEQVISTLPPTEHRLVQIQQKQEEDVIVEIGKVL